MMRLLRRLTGAERRSAERIVALTLAVLADEATPEENAEFERRYVDDDAFHAVAAPIAAIWFAPVNWTALATRAKAEQAASVAPSRARSVGKFLLKGLAYLAAAIAAIIAMAYAITFGMGVLLKTSEPDRVIGVQTVGAPGAAFAAADSTPLRVPPARRVEKPDSGSYAASLLKLVDGKGRTVTSGPGVATMLQFDHGSRVLLGPGTRAAYVTAPNNMVGRNVWGVILELRSGEMSLRVTPAEVKVQVLTRAGVAVFSPGSYAVRCTTTGGECNQLDVTVASGTGLVSIDRVGGANVTLVAGTFGRIRRGELPVVVDARAARGFPVVDPILARSP